PPLELPVAFRAPLVEQLGLRPLAPVDVPDVAALRVLVAADELPVLAELHDEVSGLAALLRTPRTELVELLLEPLDLRVGLLDRSLERPVELVEHLDPRELPLGDVVELLFHLRRERRVDDVGEELDEQIRHDLAHV